MKQNSIREGKLHIWNGMILFLGTVIDTALHRHHALQITVSLSGEFILETEAGSFSSPAVIIDSDRSHRLKGESGVQALLLLENECEIAERLKPLCLAGKGVYSPDEGAVRPALFRLRRILEDDTDIGAASDAVNFLLGALELRGIEGRPRDPRIEKALEMIHGLEEKKISANEIASALSMSETRLIHLFKRETGIPVRRYLLWKRMMDCLGTLVETGDITRAAHESGFADSAHLARTFKENFGITLSEIFKNDRFIQVIVGE
ncbi:MAG: AraC family transcriptional regulator [Desulfobacteraceae bacterium]|nr:MAG: AraC family transcriptional regulator [Desulfobacteraceae bacterium]